MMLLYVICLTILSSHRTSNGHSLNDVLYVHQLDLVMLMLRWRIFRFVFNSEVTQMTPLQQILYRHFSYDHIKNDELQTVTFGVNCPPYLAISSASGSVIASEIEIVNIKYTFEELTTILARIEACLNSRLLCPMSDSPNKIAAFKPNHFLIGDLLLAPLEPYITEEPLSIVNRLI